MASPKIKPNLFDLSKEEMETSKMLYEGKIIKCLVAPYHTYEQLEKIIPFTKTTYLFPERELPINQLKTIVSRIVQNPSKDEFRIITTNQNIIIDMADACVRVLTEKGDVVPSPVKTFMANIHDIRYSLLENPDHQKSEKEKTEGDKKVNALISKINKAKAKKSITKKEYDLIIGEINLIGEDVISSILKNMAADIAVSS